MSYTILMVAEKPSLAESISKILAPKGQYTTRRVVTPVHEYTSEFHGKKSQFKFTSVKGHVYSLDFTHTHNNWSVDPLTLFTAPTLKSETSNSICKHLNHESRHIDYLILWLDCDREGENICFEVIDNVKNNMKSLVDGKNKDQRILRAKFSAITFEDIHRAMNNLGYPNKNEALAVDARQELDLKVGCAFTRFQTLFFNDKYGDLDSRLISYGPCQTPTLSFCVTRHDQIQHFAPEKYWVLSLTISKNSINIPLKWKRVKVFDKKIADLFLKMIEQNSKDIKVVSITSEIKTRYRPTALNTVELLKFGSSNIGISPHDMMSIAEKLYMQGYISYPRTETTSYSRNFDLMSVLKSQLNSTTWGSYAKELLDDGIQRPTGGKDVGDHPPITPTKLANEEDLHGDLWRVYSFITKYFLGSISKNIKFKETTVLIKVATEYFEITGTKVIEPGFSKIMHWRKVPNEENLSEFKEGEKLNLVDYKLTEGTTTPPDYLTESEVIGLMEKHGIGTDASIPGHIDNICQRNYVKVEGRERRLVPTTLGIVLIHGYCKIDPDLSLPTMRSDVEKQLNYIASGKAEFSKVLDYFLQLFAEKFKYFRDNIDLMNELFEPSFSSLSSSGKIISKCGKCRRYMKYIQTKPQRLHCSVCNETYSLPQNGNIKLFKELKCPLDDFELLTFSSTSDEKTIILCPYCYSNPPFENVRKGMSCSQCLHPTCSYSLITNTICQCQMSIDFIDCKGKLILDQTSSNIWKLYCNTCKSIVKLKDTVKGVSVKKNESCKKEGCEANIIKIQLKENNSRVEGCILCDEEAIALLENRIVRKNITAARNRSSRGGRSRGKRTTWKRKNQ